MTSRNKLENAFAFGVALGLVALAPAVVRAVLSASKKQDYIYAPCEVVSSKLNNEPKQITDKNE